MKNSKENSFIGGTSIYLASNIINGIIPFVLLPILTRYLSPSEYGEVAMFQTLLGAFGAFVGGIFGAAANIKYYDHGINKEELAQFIGSCIQLILFFSIIVFLITLLLRNELSQALGLSSKYILLGVFTSMNTAVIGLRLGQWQVQKQTLKYGVMQISNSLFNMIFSLVFVVLLLEGSDGRINAQILTSCLFMIISIYSLNHDSLLESFVWRKDYINEALKFGVPLIPHIAGGFLLTTVDKFIINREIGLAEAGIYMVAIQLTAAIGVVFDAINKAYIPWLFEKLKEDDHQQKVKIVKYTYAWFLLILIGACIAFYIGPYLVVLIAGEKYAEASKVIGWLSLGQAFQGMYLMVTNYIFYSKKTGMLSIATLSSGMLNLVLLIVLVRILGLKGASIAFAISMGIRFLLTWYIAHKRHPMPWFNFSLKV